MTLFKMRRGARGTRLTPRAIQEKLILLANKKVLHNVAWIRTENRWIITYLADYQARSEYHELTLENTGEAEAFVRGCSVGVDHNIREVVSSRRYPTGRPLASF